MEKVAPFAQPNNGPAIFAALRDVLAELYAEESTARVVVDDAGLDAKQIPFSARAQTNWHNILAEAIRQAHLDPLLKIALANYATNPTLLAAYDQYRLLIEQGSSLEAPDPLPADAGVTIAGDVNLNQGDFVGHDKLIAGDDVGGDKVEGDKIDARASQGFLNRPTAPVTQHFGTAINIGAHQIPIYLVIIISACIIGIFSVVAYPFVEQWLPPSRAFATQANGETLIVIATFHNTAATNSEAHTKIRRAIADAAATNNEQQLRVEVEPTELTADQRTEAEALGKRYNANMLIWGEDTGVEVIVNFLNLKEPDFDAASATLTERERTQLANPSAYTRFITQDLPQTMSFFALFTIGQSYDLNDQYTLAIKRIEAAVASVPSATQPEGLAEAYFRLGWLYQVPTIADLNKAIANYDQAIRLNPDYATAYINRGTARYMQSKLEGALADYDQVIRLNPNYKDAYIGRGNVRRDQGKLQEALADYNQAIRLDPDFAGAYNNRGNVRRDQGKLEEALADHNQAIRLSPNYADAYNNRGNVRYVQGELDEALADYEQAIRLAPDNADAYIGRGNVRYVQGELDEALADYEQAIRLAPDNAGAYIGRGNIRRGQGELEEALADYEQAIRLKPNYADAYYGRGNIRRDQGELEEALADYEQAIRLAPDNAGAYIGRGNVRYVQSKLDEAIADYDQAIRINSVYANAFWGRGLAYRKLSKPKEALADFRHYLELQPNAENRTQFEVWIAEAEAELAKLK